MKRDYYYLLDYRTMLIIFKCDMKTPAGYHGMMFNKETKEYDENQFVRNDEFLMHSEFDHQPTVEEIRDRHPELLI